jgi:Hemolysins and related proteins containing CBS domains
MSDSQIVALTLLFSALCSGLEIAFTSTNRLQLELDLKKNKFSARIINLFFKNQSRFITSLLLCNNIVLTIYGISIARLLEPFVLWLLPQSITSEFMILLVQTILSTLIILVMGEFLPKILFRINPNGILGFFSLPTAVFYFLLYPLILLYTGISEFIIRYVFRMTVDREDYKFSTVDLNDYISEYANPEEVSEDVQQEIHLFQNAMEFRSVKLRECMEPRNEIQSVKRTDDLEDVQNLFEQTKHSKLIVYSENIDNIIGYIHLNDVVDNIMHGRQKTSVESLVRPIDFFPETYNANRLLRHFILKHQAIAVVVDEFGGTAGIVTMEDIIEEIFGEINDEYDEEEGVQRKLRSDTFILSARLEIDYLNETYGLQLPVSEDYETLAGMILHFYESIPEQGEEIVIGNYKIKIIKASNKKLEEVELKILP